MINFINVYISFMPIQFRPTPICLFSVDISIWVHTNHTFTSHHGTNFSKYFLYLKFPQLREEVFNFKTCSLPLRRFFFYYLLLSKQKGKNTIRYRGTHLFHPSVNFITFVINRGCLFSSVSYRSLENISGNFFGTLGIGTESPVWLFIIDNLNEYLLK